MQNLLSFARQVPPERTLLDINSVVTSAVQLRALDLPIAAVSRIDMQLESVLPGVRGDDDQLMQVFFNIINNGLDAMSETGGGVLTIRTLRDRGNVVILFSDTASQQSPILRPARFHLNQRANCREAQPMSRMS